MSYHPHLKAKATLVDADVQCAFVLLFSVLSPIGEYFSLVWADLLEVVLPDVACL